MPLFLIKYGLSVVQSLDADNDKQGRESNPVSLEASYCICSCDWHEDFGWPRSTIF
jgi:hypothetical protein